MYRFSPQQFGKMEIETAASDWKASEVQKSVYNITKYVITSDGTISTETLMAGLEGKITIIYQPSMIDPDSKVMQVQLP